MQAGKAIYYILTNSAANTSLVSRIYPEIAPFDAIAPFCVYELESTEPSDTKSGVSTLDTLSYSLSVVTGGYSDLATLVTQVRTALDRYSGDANGVTVQSLRVTNVATGYDQEAQKYIGTISFDIRVRL